MRFPLSSWSKLFGKLRGTNRSRKRHSQSFSRRRLCFENLDARNMLAVFAVADAEIGVGEEQGVAYVTVYAFDHGQQTVSVGYSTVPGTAAANADYGSVNDRLTFGPDDVSLTIPVSIIDDAFSEPDESFTLILASPSAGSTLDEGMKTTTITILENTESVDPQPEINIVDFDMTVPDESGDVDFGTTTVGQSCVSDADRAKPRHERAFAGQLERSCRFFHRCPAGFEHSSARGQHDVSREIQC